MSPETTALCLTCGSEEEVEDLKDGLCRICQTYPEDSYEWHLAICFRGGDPTSDEADAFRSGWLRAFDAAQRRLRDKTGLDLDLGLDLYLDPKPA